MKKITNFIKEVSKEMSKVRFSTKKEMLTYTVATIAFIIVFALFFTATDIVLAFLKQLVR